MYLRYISTHCFHFVTQTWLKRWKFPIQRPSCCISTSKVVIIWFWFYLFCWLVVHSSWSLILRLSISLDSKARFLSNSKPGGTTHLFVRFRYMFVCIYEIRKSSSIHYANIWHLKPKGFGMMVKVWVFKCLLSSKVWCLKPPKYINRGARKLAGTPELPKDICHL